MENELGYKLVQWALKHGVTVEAVRELGELLNEYAEN